MGNEYFPGILDSVNHELGSGHGIVEIQGAQITFHNAGLVLRKSGVFAGIVKDKGVIIKTLANMKGAHREIRVDIFSLEAFDLFLGRFPFLFLKQDSDLRKQLRTSGRDRIVVGIGRSSPQRAFVKPDKIIGHTTVNRSAKMAVANRQSLLKPRCGLVIT